ncbi:sensor histidine kinase [Patiriisocius marinistellae]|uniref:histidine kinase n=1 Tax=Patiriisocius marinistellae TaxID=2494560 RepID=A0A5J4FYM7_9FLAO|nr:GAF domain-containing sensor histidine kinase [Patiriisocius marinistellae]GEQ86478.1 sensor histidine kinase [Patiriisocius marinistellae]
MIKPNIPHNESARLAALRSYNILNTDTNEIAFEQITHLASQITGMPISLISIVDREEVWFKSTKGMNICSSDRNESFCSYAVGHENDTFVLEDIRNHKELKHHPYANMEKNSIQFYAGVCLIDSDGYKLGTLCVIDTKPNKISEQQIEALKILSKQIIKLIEFHKANQSLLNVQKELETKNESLRSFAGVVSHDMKMPLANIIVTADILRAKYGGELDAQAKKYLDYLKNSSFTLSDYITGLLNHYESDSIKEGGVYESFDLNHLLEEIIDLLNIKFDCEIHFPENNIELDCNRSALEQIFLNLIGNSLKYNDKDKIIINIDAKVTEKEYYFTINDNGVGIPEDKIEDIFTLFTTVGNTDRNGNKGNGIGLSTVQKLVMSLGGTIKVESIENQGTSFIFTIARNFK